MEIYFWSIIVQCAINLFSFGTLFTSKPGASIFDGYTSLTVAIVVNGALMGQCVSFVMKYADNIVKVFAACTALFLSTALSTLFTDFTPDMLLILGFVVTVCSLFLYLGPHNSVLKAHEDHQPRL